MKPHTPIGSATPDGQSKVVQSLLQKLGLNTIPPHPVREKGKVSIYFDMLHCEPHQLDAIQKLYVEHQHYHRIFSELDASQEEARECLREQKLVFEDMGDLGNGWSRRWSSTTNESTGPGSSKGLTTQRILFQCQSGTSTTARQNKVHNRKLLHGHAQPGVETEEWKRKMPYDYTSCLAHLDLTYTPQSSEIYRITGILNHNDACKDKLMSRFPSVPLHPHVWQDALKEINRGANLTAIQKRNYELYFKKQYEGQEDSNPEKANFRWILLPGDSRTLYRKQALSFGVDLQKPPAENVDNWLNPNSFLYKPEVASAAFSYQGRTHKQERFMICIHTEDMKAATWNYSHGKQLILDGTFGICDRRILLFIALGVDKQNRGIPLAFFLFSAPTGNQATHAGYDTSILTQLLKSWVMNMGTREGQTFSPKVAITDTDTKERGALLSVWPHITLLLCKFHTRQCWTNKRRLLIKIGQTDKFHQEQINKRLQNLEKALINSEKHEDAVALVNSEKMWLTALQSPLNSSISRITISGSLSYLDYLLVFWLSKPIWESWSAFGRLTASKILGIPLEGVVPTTNHLEAFNGVLKHKHLHQYQKNGRHIRFDLLIVLLIKYILPGVFKQRTTEREYYDWLSIRFGQQIHNQDILEVRKSKSISKSNDILMKRHYAITWWSSDLQAQSHNSAQYIIAHQRITDFEWIASHTIKATCASSLSNVNAKDHIRYELSLNSYGLAACSCPFNSMGHGACKHLWAFRYILPTLSPTVSFYFPLTEQAGKEIHGIFFPRADSASTSEHLPRAFPSNTDLPTPPTNDLFPAAAISNTLTSMIADLEASGLNESDDGNSEGIISMDNSDNELELQHLEVPGLASKDALQQQIQGCINQELTMLLPRLHGLTLLLKEGKQSLHEIPQFPELKAIVSSLSEALSETGNMNTSLDAEIPLTQERFVKSQIHQRVQDLIPPSPQLRQKRKRSTGTL